MIKETLRVEQDGTGRCVGVKVGRNNDQNFKDGLGSLL